MSISLNDDDVISIDPGQNFAKTSTSTIKEIRAALIEDWLTRFANWMGGGVSCQAMLAKQVGWHKGKIRLCLEFIPDNPADFVDETTSNKTPATNPSPLDDLRSNLNLTD